MNEIRESRPVPPSSWEELEKGTESPSHCRLRSSLRASIYHLTPAELDIGILDPGNRGTQHTCPKRSGSVLAGLCGCFCCLALSSAVCGCSTVCRLLCPAMALDEYPQTCIDQVLLSPALGLVITHVEVSPDSAHRAVDILVSVFLGIAA